MKKRVRTYQELIAWGEDREHLLVTLGEVEESDDVVKITERWLLFEKELDGGDTSGDVFGNLRGLKKTRESKGADQITFLEYLRMARLYENEKDCLLKRTGYYHPMVEGS